jgi:ABC-type dipeptide/oligopeptide/nickel transport system ATPase component
MDLRLNVGCCMQVVGASGSGKTLFTTSLLRQRRVAFKVPLKKIWWLYGADEGEIGKTANEIQKLDNVEFIKGFVEGWQTLPQRHDVLVIDDLFMESGREKDLTNIFTRTARHRELFVIFITQNLFQNGMRSRNLSTHYLVVFKNPRDSLTISTIGRQMGNFPLREVFEDATHNKPYGYIFIDFTQECVDDLRVRTNLFQPPMYIYRKV